MCLRISASRFLLAVSILLIFGGLFLTSSAALLSQCFSKVKLEPSCVFGATSWTDAFNISQGSMYVKPIYLDYGEAVNCFYFSSVPVDFYVFDFGSFSRYVNNPIFQALNGMRISYFGFARFIPLVPGWCCILIINPVRYYSAFGEISLYKYSTVPIVTFNSKYTFCVYTSISGIIISTFGGLSYFIIKRYEKRN